MAETLASNSDMTTNLDIWLDSEIHATLDLVSSSRTDLIAHFALVTTTQDFTTLLAMFLRRNATS